VADEICADISMKSGDVKKMIETIWNLSRRSCLENRRAFFLE
jgi:hypothetical protein